jgi:hypothetical protein
MRKHSVPAKRVIDSHCLECNNISNAGERVATPQLGQGPDPKLSFQQDGSHGSPESESKRMLSDSKTIEPHQMRWLWQETVRRLETLQSRAREGKCVDEASEFARWLRMSGLHYVFDKASWATIEKLIVDVLWDCESFYKKHPQGPWVKLSELEAVNQKLDRIAGRLAQISVPTTGEAGLNPALSVHLRAA